MCKKTKKQITNGHRIKVKLIDRCFFPPHIMEVHSDSDLESNKYP